MLSLPLLGGCGLKDDLYLPPEPVAPSAQPPESESDEDHAENPGT